MTNRELLAALNAAGDALAELGEDSITLGRFQSPLFEGDKPRFSCRLDLEGTSGVQASADTLAGAVVKAMADREDKRRELAEQAEFRAAFEASRETRKAA